MTTQTSHRKCTLELMGETVTGLADDDPPVEIPQIEMITTKFGQDGTMYAHNLEILGGELMVKLLPTSPWCKKMLRWMAEMQNGMRLDFTGTYGDSELGFSTQLEGGVMTKCPPAVIPNQTFEVSFMFEEMRPQYDSAKFAASPHEGSAPAAPPTTP